MVILQLYCFPDRDQHTWNTTARRKISKLFKQIILQRKSVGHKPNPPDVEIMDTFRYNGKLITYNWLALPTTEASPDQEIV